MDVANMMGECHTAKNSYADNNATNKVISGYHYGDNR